MYTDVDDYLPVMHQYTAKSPGASSHAIKEHTSLFHIIRFTLCTEVVRLAKKKRMRI